MLHTQKKEKKKRPPLYLLTFLKLGDRLCYLLTEVEYMGEVRNQ